MVEWLKTPTSKLSDECCRHLQLLPAAKELGQRRGLQLVSIFACSPVHFLMMSSHLFLCLSCLLTPFTVPCKMFSARPDEREDDHTTAVCVSLRWSGGLRGPIACWILTRTSSLITWSLCDIHSIVACGSTSFPWLVFFFRALL